MSIVPSSLTLEDIKSRFLPSSDYGYNVERKAMVKAEILSIMARLINDLSGVTSIEVCGYTPGFNDGDPCRHSQMDPNVNVINSNEYHDRRYDSRKSDFDPSIYPAEMVDDETYSLIASICDGMSDMFEDAFDTDFSVVVWRNENDNFAHEVGRYDCGY